MRRGFCGLKSEDGRWRGGERSCRSEKWPLYAELPRASDDTLRQSAARVKRTPASQLQPANVTSWTLRLGFTYLNFPFSLCINEGL
jgi:hypothetical protein